MKKVFIFAKLCAYVMGAVGGLFLAFTEGYVLIGIAVAVLAALAFPEFKRLLTRF
ncbi:MAG: hypothetical protein MJZ81_06175 [Bacteroidales bacterium]|nr:hypothetical protein [Bacteroidales bacterium]